MADSYQIISSNVSSLLDRGIKPWGLAHQNSRYRNAISGHIYTGKNPVILQSFISERNYTNSLFVGFDQARKHKFRMIKNSKACYIQLGGSYDKEEVDRDLEKVIKTRITFKKLKPIFNLDCFTFEDSELSKEDYIAKNAPEKLPAFDLQKVQKIIDSQNIEVRTEAGSDPTYSICDNYIQLSPIENYRTTFTYYHLLINQLVKATAHQSKLDRVSNLNYMTTQDDVMFEELVADISTHSICSSLGIDSTVTSRYLSAWSKMIKADKKILLSALDLAQKATNYILGQ